MTNTKAKAVIIFLLASFIILNAPVTTVQAMQYSAGNEKNEFIKQESILHGILEVVTTNQKGEQSLQARMDVWWDSDGRYHCKIIGGYLKGIQIANNGQKKWMIIPGEKRSILYPAYPDTWKFIFQPGKEIYLLKKDLKVKKIGEDTISERHAVIEKVWPKGGLPYYVWIDKATGLIMKKETEMQNGLKQRIAYTHIEFCNAFPPELLNYSLPEGYAETPVEYEEFAVSQEEIRNLSGFTPKQPDKVPKDYVNAGMSFT